MGWEIEGAFSVSFSFFYISIVKSLGEDDAALIGLIGLFVFLEGLF
jgi:hypothetical protein